MENSLSCCRDADDGSGGKINFMSYGKFASVKFGRAMRPEAHFPIAVIVILLACSPIAQGWRSFKVIFTSFPYQFNSDYLDVKIQIDNNTAETTLNVVLNFNEDVDDVSLKYAIALEYNEGNFTALVNRSVNFCKFLKQRSLEPVLRIIYEDLSKQGNFMKTCPIRKGSYSLRDYRIDEEMLPSYVPETSFFVDIQLDLSKGGYLFKGKLHGKIDKSKGFNNLKMFSLG